ncbi:MAG: hypothetical protein AB1571_02605 [Nanoarchaeota archaeon]
MSDLTIQELDKYKAIIKAINNRLNKILYYIELSNPSNYKNLRKLILDSFGESGIRKELREILFKGKQNES